MVLGTVSADCRPSTRIVLLKDYDHSGFTFYTNYDSRKGIEITHNPAVSLLFWWEALERQVRIEGVAQKISAAQSALYFHSRPKNSQLAALASQQSQPLHDLAELQTRYQHLCTQYARVDAIVPCPDYWGGYLVTPERLEYWQGGENRLHDRFQYTRQSSGKWDIIRQYP